MAAPFRDRVDAGRQLAPKLSRFAANDPVVLGLARGGVVVAAKVAAALGAPLEALVARKLGVPWQPELGFGAVAPGARVVDEELVSRLHITPEDVERVTVREREEMQRRLGAYQSDRGQVPLEGRTVLIVDDGLATGITARAAAASVRARRPARIVFAAPVCSTQGVALLEREVVDVVACHVTDRLHAVGAWYEDFSQTGDDEVDRILSECLREELVEIDGRSAVLRTPPDAAGLVIFIHGSGSGMNSPRNRQVARALSRQGFATLLVDLLQQGESDRTFDIPFLARRTLKVVEWARALDLPIGLFGASTGAAAALLAASDSRAVLSVVSRGGRTDLTPQAALERVDIPTLWIVGSLDSQVLQLNRQAARCPARPPKFEVVQGAGHLFEEPGTLERVADLAVAWFADTLPRDGSGILGA